MSDIDNKNLESYPDDDINTQYSDEQIEQEARELRITREFQENVIKYVKLDDLIRNREKEVRELKKQRKPCEEYILNYLERVDENIIEITNGKLRRNKCATKVPLTKAIIKSALIEKIRDPLKVDELLVLMNELRPKKERINLKRTTIRKI